MAPDSSWGLGDPHEIATGAAPLDIDVGDLNQDGAPDAVVTDRGGLLVVYGQPPNIVPNDSAATTRDLGTIVHFLDQKQTIVPGREEAFLKFTVPTEFGTAADEVIDISLTFGAF